MLRPRSSGTRARTIALLCSMLVGAGGCIRGADEGGLGPDAMGPDAPPTGPVVFRFDLTPGSDGAIPLDQLPYPNNIHLGADGYLKVTDSSLGMPLGEPGALAAIAGTLQRRKGFGVTTGVILPVAGLADGDALDPATLGSVKLIALPSGNMLPVHTHVRVGGLAKGALYVSPAPGTTLEQGATYAVLVDRGVRTLGGVDVGAGAGLAETLAGESFRLLREHLVDVPHPNLIAATQFTTDRPMDVLVAARALVQSEALGPVVVDRVVAGADLEVFLGTPVDNSFPGRDNEGGIAHASISAIVIGHFRGIDFLSADEQALGAWDLGTDGAPIVKGQEDIPFLLAIPAGLDSLADLRVAIFQHGLNGSRDSVLAVANSFCASGIAVIGIDIPFHGARFPAATDVVHNATKEPGADGLADDAGFNQSLTFFDITGDEARGVAVFDPNVMASVLRQTSVDFMSLARLLGEGDWSAVAAELPGFSLASERLLLAGESFGSITGALAVALEPRIGAFFLAVGGGGLMFPLLSQSPNYWPIFGSLATSIFGVPEYDVQPDRDPPETHLPFILFQSLLEAGDPLTYASHAHRPVEGVAKHVVLVAVQWDESVSNASTEGLASAMGLQHVPLSASPAATEAPRYVTFSDTPVPVAGNITTDDGPVTGALVYLEQANHGVITNGHAELRWQPPFPPFVLREPSVEFDNPIAQLQALMIHATRTYYETGTPELVDTFLVP